MSNLEKLTKAELKELAEEKEIEVPSSATKAEIVEAIEASDQPTTTDEPVDTGVIMSGAGGLTSKSTKETEVTAGEGLVKVEVSRNLYWEGVGRLTKGVTVVAADSKWLDHPKVKRVD